MVPDSLPEGKISHQILKRLISMTGSSDEAVIQPPFPGHDVAAFDWEKLYHRVSTFYGTSSSPYLVYKSDPITFPTSRPGWYAITVNQNDLATVGALPIAITITMLIPSNMTEDEVIAVQQDLHGTASQRNIIIAGGHTEVTSAVNQLILSFNMIGMVPPEFYVGTKVQSGSRILISGWIGAEGTGILLDAGDDYWQNHLDAGEIETGKTIGRDLNISDRVLAVIREHHDNIMTIHDITEGGILSAIFEILEPQGLGAELQSDLPIAKVTRDICNLLGIDAKKLIGSGAVLIFCDSAGSHEVLQSLKQFDFPAMDIGRVISNQDFTIDSDHFAHSEDAIITGLEKLDQLNQ